jgi:hypothetical protein
MTVPSLLVGEGWRGGSPKTQRSRYPFSNSPLQGGVSMLRVAAGVTGCRRIAEVDPEMHF